MNNGRINIWLCNFFVLMFILIFFGVSQSFAQQDSVYFNTEALSSKYGYVRFERGEEKYTTTDSADSAYTPTEVKYFANSTVRLFYNMHRSCGLGAYIEVPQKGDIRLMKE